MATARANRVTGFEFFAIGARNQVGGTQGVVAAAAVSAGFRGFLLGYGVLCHK